MLLVWKHFRKLLRIPLSGRLSNASFAPRLRSTCVDGAVVGHTLDLPVQLVTCTWLVVAVPSALHDHIWMSSLWHLLGSYFRTLAPLIGLSDRLQVEVLLLIGLGLHEQALRNTFQVVRIHVSGRVVVLRLNRAAGVDHHFSRARAWTLLVWQILLVQKLGDLGAFDWMNAYLFIVWDRINYKMFTFYRRSRNILWQLLLNLSLVLLPPTWVSWLTYLRI